VGTDGSPHGGTPVRESHARPDGCGGHHLRFCENGLDHFAKWASVQSEITYLGNFGPEPIWQSGLIRSHNEFVPQDVLMSTNNIANDDDLNVSISVND